MIRPKIDLGPGTKLIPTIEAELKLGNTHTRIVTVDDDNEGHWTSDSLLQLFAYSLYFEDAALGFTGWNATCMVEDAHCSPQDSGVPERNFRDRWYNFIRQTDDYACHTLSDWLPQYFANCMGAVRKNFVAYADVLEGFRGALYQPRFFALKDLKTLTNAKLVPKYFFLVDDVWFSGWLGVRNISRLVVNPAIHKEAPVAKALRAYSDKRKINRVMAPLTPKDLASQGTPTEVEGGLHSLGINFVEANHLGAKWFGKKGAWGKDLWDRPPGFVYNSEKRMRKSKGD